MSIKNPLKAFFSPDILGNDEKRYRIQFIVITFILGMVAAGMTVLNVITNKGFLTWATFFFSTACFLNMFLFIQIKKRLRIPKILFAFIIILLFVYFIISGSPEGFSPIWIYLLPACGMLVYGRKSGTFLCMIVFAVIAFLLLTPLGYSLFQYDYTMVFRRRFPLSYIAFFIIGYFIELIRERTYTLLLNMQERYFFLYRHDALTKIYNRHGFNELLDQTIKEHSNYKTLTLMIMDIDHFKEINDTYGHVTGDEVLIHLSKLIAGEMDDNSVVCRWGGEEFAILIRGNATLDSVTEFAERLREKVQDTPVQTDATTLNITVSVGSVLADLSEDLEVAKLVNTADACMYKAKENGRNRCDCVRL